MNRISLTLQKTKSVTKSRKATKLVTVDVESLKPRWEDLRLDSKGKVRNVVMYNNLENAGIIRNSYVPAITIKGMFTFF
jgi:hypothetical protein